MNTSRFLSDDDLRRTHVSPRDYFAYGLQVRSPVSLPFASLACGRRRASVDVTVRFGAVRACAGRRCTSKFRAARRPAADGAGAAFVAHVARRMWAPSPSPGRLAILADWSRKRLAGLLRKPAARHVLHELASVGIGFRDWSRLDLPDRLFFLYVPLQPLLWLTRKPPSLAFFIPTLQEVVDRMLELAGVTAEDVVYDLGCGDGRIVVTAAERFGARSIGVDIDPQRIAEANENAERAGVRHLATFVMQDAMKVDVSEATVVTLFLPKPSNLKLRPRLESQLPVGARIVSYVPGNKDWVAEGDWAADQVERFRDERGNAHTLYLWRQ